jgi:hypothetical protein
MFIFIECTHTIYTYFLVNTGMLFLAPALFSLIKVVQQPFSRPGVDFCSDITCRVVAESAREHTLQNQFSLSIAAGSTFQLIYHAYNSDICVL